MFMNQGKLEVVKQEMTRVNINILGVSELKCTGMGKFNSDDHYKYYCRQEYWSGLPCPLPGHLPDPWIKPASPALAEPPGKPTQIFSQTLI